METIIFDIGNVLLEFDPEQYLLKKYDKELTYTLMTIIFSSPYWDALDLGEITTQQVIDLLSKENPKYKEEIAFVLNHWHEMMLPMEENIELLYKLKEKGYKLYILSNFNDEAFHKLVDQFEFFKLFDGSVISYEIHKMKPSHHMYKALIEKYHINPLTSLFIDDMCANVDTAKRYDMDTIWMRYGINLKEQLLKKKIL